VNAEALPMFGYSRKPASMTLVDVRFSNRPVMGWTRRALASCSRKPAWGCENQEHSMPSATSCTNLIATIGIDIGKNTFHVIGLDDKGAIILRHKLSRGQVYARLANIPRA
jgi:transposase